MLNGQTHKTLANQAAKAGVIAAQKCLAELGLASMNQPVVSTNCAASATPAKVIAAADGNSGLESTYRATATAQTIGGNPGTLLVSVGTVKIKGAVVTTDSVRAFVPTVLSANSSLNVTQVSTGPATACVIATDPATGTGGWPYCWGDTSNNQLGLGYHIGDVRFSSAYSTVPMPVARGHVDGRDEVTQKRFVCNGWNTNILGCLSWASYTAVDWYVPASGGGAAGPGLNSAMQNKVASKVSVGTNHTCAVARDSESDVRSSKAYCWGKNDYGQLGTRDNTEALVPMAADTRAAWSVTIPGYCNGYSNPFTGCAFPTGVYVNPVTTNYPGSALFSKTVTDIMAGNYFTCVRYVEQTDVSNSMTMATVEALPSKVSCWGKNDNGQLGNNSRSTSNIPVDVVMSGSTSSLRTERVKSLATVKGGSTMCAISTLNNAHCWGENYAGQVGNGGHAGSFWGAYRDGYPITSDTFSGFPIGCPLGYLYPGVGTGSDALIPSAVLTTGGGKYRSISVYDNWVTGITTTNAAYHWGGTTSIGCGFLFWWDRYYYYHDPEVYTKLSWFAPNFPSLTSGNIYKGQFCSVAIDNSLYCTSVRPLASAPTPPAPTRLNSSERLLTRPIVAIDTGANGDYGCIVTRVSSNDGQVDCWGSNTLGQLGNRTLTPRSTAFPVDTYGTVGDSPGSALSIPSTTIAPNVIYF